MMRRKAIARAVVELRTRMQWGQEDLAREIGRLTYHPVRGRLPRPDRTMIWRWESGQQPPNHIHRWALGKIARSHKHDDLANIFCANNPCWRLVELVTELLSRDDT